MQRWVDSAKQLASGRPAGHVLPRPSTAPCRGTHLSLLQVAIPGPVLPTCSPVEYLSARPPRISAGPYSMGQVSPASSRRTKAKRGGPAPRRACGLKIRDRLAGVRWLGPVGLAGRTATCRSVRKLARTVAERRVKSVMDALVRRPAARVVGMHRDRGLKPTATIRAPLRGAWVWDRPGTPTLIAQVSNLPHRRLPIGTPLDGSVGLRIVG